MKNPKLKKITGALKSVRHLSGVDPKLKLIIDEVGPVQIRIDPEESIYRSLSRAIVYQQLHGKAAATILKRVILLFNDQEEFPSPKAMLEMNDARLLAAGLSRNKLLAMKDLAKKAHEKSIPDRKQASTMSDEELIEALVTVRGIGPWTAQMMLIFTLGRTDVLPVLDFGVRKGLTLLQGKKKMIHPKKMENLCAHWAPYRSIGSWYLWRVLELPQFKNIKVKP